MHGEDIIQEVDGGADLRRLFRSRSVLGMNKSPCDRKGYRGKQEILRSLYAELEALQGAVEKGKYADSKTADIRRKLITDIRQLETQYSIDATVQIGIDFCEFLKNIDKDFAIKVSDYYHAFINEQLDKRKWQK